MTEKNNRFPFEEDNYTHNIDRNNERKLDRRGFMKTLVGAAGVFAVSSIPWGVMAANELAGLSDKEYPKQKITNFISFQRIFVKRQSAFYNKIKKPLIMKAYEHPKEGSNYGPID